MRTEVAILGLHYSLMGKDNHSMNAVIHNECERCFINALLSLNKYLDKPIEVEICAEEEGGIRNKIKVYTTSIILGLTINLLYDFGKFFLDPNIKTSDDILTKIDVVQRIKSTMASDDPFTEAEFDYIATNDRDLRKLKSEYFKTAKKDNSTLVSLNKC